LITRRGEIWSVDLNPTRGHEQSKTRPAVVVSLPAMTQALGMAIIIPLTSTDRGWIWHVVVPASAATGLRNASYAMLEQMRSVDFNARFRSRIGQVPPETLEEVDDKIRLALGWPQQA